MLTVHPPVPYPADAPHGLISAASAIGGYSIPIGELADGIVSDNARLALAAAIERALPVFDTLEANAQPVNPWDAGIIVNGVRL